MSETTNIYPFHDWEKDSFEISNDVDDIGLSNRILQIEFKTMEESSGVQAVDDVAVSSTMTVLWINILIFITLMGSYELFNRMLPSVYAGKQRHVRNDFMTSKLTSYYLPLGWVIPVSRVSWPQVLQTSGLDAYMFLRYIRMCLIITSVSGFWGVLILFPTYASAEGGAEGWYFLSMANIPKYGSAWRLWVPTIFMYFLTFFVFYLMNEEYKHYLELRMEYLSGINPYDTMIQKSTTEDPSESNLSIQHLYSLTVNNIPHHLRSDRDLFQYFNELFPDKIHSACVVMNIPDLEALVARRRRVVRRLEKSIAIHEATGNRGTHVAGRKRIRMFGVESLPINPFRGRKDYIDDYEDRLPQRGERVDSISYYTRDLVDMNDEISSVQEEKKKVAMLGNEKVSASARIASKLEKIRKDGLVLGFREADSNKNTFFLRIIMGFLFGGLSLLDHHLDVVVDSVEGNAMSSYGFVTFKTLSTVVCGASTRVTTASILSVSPSSEPNDIIWQNAHIDSAIIYGREFTSNCFLFLGVIFWSVPVASIQALATIEEIAKILNMDWILKYKGGRIAAFVNGYLPILALLGLINLLPFIFSWIAIKYENRKTYSDVQNSILGRFFYYQLANIYITVTAASLWDSLGDIIEHPSSALTFLGETLPSVVGYFIAFLITKILAGLPIVMLRLGALSRMLFIKFWFKEKMITQRELDEVYKRQNIYYGWEYPTQLLVIVICFTYSCISPIILPVGSIYFLFALIVYKYQCMVVYCPTYEGGGLMFTSVCNRTLIGLICGQMSMMGYMLIRQGLYQLLIMLPLPYITYRMMSMFYKVYAIPSRILSLERAKEVDFKNKEDSIVNSFNKDLYRQPSLADPMAEPMPYRREDNSQSGPRVFYRGQSNATIHTEVEGGTVI